MKKSKHIFLFAAMLAALHGSAQTISAQEYINTYKSIAISEMKRTGIPASITLAQGLLETESGNSELVKRSNNHFGIKCKSNWSGESVSHDDDAPGECFRKYNNATDSYYDHSNFLRGSSRYAFLFQLDPMDYKGWAYGLKKAGYATNPRYPQILIKHIEENNLHQYDLEAEGQQVDDVPVNKEVATIPAIKKDTVVTPAEPIIKPVVFSEMNVEQNKESIKAGRTLFNGLKAVYVPKGTSLLAVATQFDVPLAKLLEYNDLTQDGLLKEEQWIFLERKLKEGNRDFYITGPGESLYSIAQVNAIQLGYLLQYNEHLKEGSVCRKGTKVWLRPVAGKQSDTKQKTVTRFHEVQPKEGLYSISKKYNVPVNELRELNGLSGDELQVGQQLIISK
ncbi:MAG: LysM peptidoglycan-binding domain-containing protein [Bacteroidetes bacterium]|nr:LysM peptidoglycan-binding domain-containing protein [Bacteroidota bacterium]